MLPFRDNLPSCCELSHIRQGVACLGSKREEVEALFDRKGDHHSHISLALVVPLVADQASTSTSLQMDMIPLAVSLGNKIHEEYQQQSGKYDFSPSYLCIYSFAKCFFVF